MDGPNHGMFRNLQIFRCMQTGNNRVLPNVAANYLALRLLGLLRVGSGPGEKFFRAPSKSRPTKIFTLNQKDWLSVAEEFALGVKGLLCIIDK